MFSHSILTSFFSLFFSPFSLICMLTLSLQRHRFWSHEDNQEDLIFKVWAEPQGLDHGFDEKFIRNLIAYQRDCQISNVKPCPFQLSLIAYDSATLATPPFWVPFWLLSSVQYIMAYWIGSLILGYVAVHEILCYGFGGSANDNSCCRYKPTYPEYYNDSKNVSKTK